MRITGTIASGMRCPHSSCPRTRQKHVKIAFCQIAPLFSPEACLCSLFASEAAPLIPPYFHASCLDFGNCHSCLCCCLPRLFLPLPDAKFVPTFLPPSIDHRQEVVLSSPQTGEHHTLLAFLSFQATASLSFCSRDDCSVTPRRRQKRMGQ